MNPRLRRLRPLVWVVLFFCIWQFGELYNYAYAFQHGLDGPDRPGAPIKTTAGEFEGLINDVNTLLQKLEEQTEADQAVEQGISDITTKMASVQNLDKAIRDEFKATEKKLKDAGLPPEILKRHRDMVSHYEENLTKLQDGISGIKALKDEEKALRKANKSTEADAKKKEFKTKLKETGSFLKEKIKKKKYRKLDPEKLPFRSPKPIEREPRLKKEDFRDPNKGPVVDDRKPIQVAAVGDLSGLLLAQANSAPTAEDLAETIEIKFTPDIEAKAAELENDPVKIFNWVRNNVDFVPTYGSIQGAQMTLETMQGNAFDQASLLIALLRAANIPARYEYGTVEIPIDKVMNWVGGVTDPMLAGEVLSSNGIPGMLMQAGGQIVFATLEHVWVKAYVDYIPSRGAVHKQGDTWIPMDPSFKQFDYTAGVDIAAAVPFDAEAFVNQIQATATINEAEGYVTNVDQAYIEQTMTDYQAQVESYMTANHPDATVGDVLGKKIIQEQLNPVLHASLPYRLIARAGEFAEIPGNLRHRIRFKVLKDQLDQFSDTYLDFTASIPELAGRKITLSYSPATEGDEAVIESYLPEPHADGTPIQPEELPQTLPAYLINMKPELRIDGELVASGTPVGLGEGEEFSVQFMDPSGVGNEILRHDVNVGEYDALVVDPVAISTKRLTDLKARLENTQAKLEADDLTNLTKDDVLGDLFFATISSYFAELDTLAEITEKTQGVIRHRLPSTGRFFLSLSVNRLFGFPRSVSAGGLEMDVARSFSYALEKAGDREKAKQFNLNVGMNASVLEHSVPETFFTMPDNPLEAVSAVKALAIANSEGTPIYRINESNISSILPNLQLDGDTISDIQNAVNAGKEVTVQKQEIDFNGRMVAGYLIIDPETGAGAYMLAGGTNGASALFLWFLQMGYYLLVALQYAGMVALAFLGAYFLPYIIAAAIVLVNLIGSMLISAYFFVQRLVLFSLPFVLPAYAYCVDYFPTLSPGQQALCGLVIGIAVIFIRKAP